MLYFAVYCGFLYSRPVFYSPLLPHSHYCYGIMHSGYNIPVRKFRRLMTCSRLNSGVCLYVPLKTTRYNDSNRAVFNVWLQCNICPASQKSFVYKPPTNVQRALLSSGLCIQSAFLMICMSYSDIHLSLIFLKIWQFLRVSTTFINMTVVKSLKLLFAYTHYVEFYHWKIYMQR